MRFTQFLIEQDDPEQYQQAAQTLLNDCRPFFQEVNFDPGISTSLYRGVKIEPSPNQILYQKQIRQSRKPTDTPWQIQQYLDHYFKQHYGYPFRSAAIFATGSKGSASYYGHLCMVFPIGRFKYLWSNDIHDLYGRIRDRFIEQDLVGPSADMPKDLQLNHYHEQTLEDILDEVHYQGNNLAKAIQSHAEIMIAADSYYAVSVKHHGNDLIAAIRDLLDKER